MTKDRRLKHQTLELWSSILFLQPFYLVELILPPYKAVEIINGGCRITHSGEVAQVDVENSSNLPNRLHAYARGKIWLSSGEPLIKASVMNQATRQSIHLDQAKSGFQPLQSLCYHESNPKYGMEQATRSAQH